MFSTNMPSGSINAAAPARAVLPRGHSREGAGRRQAENGRPMAKRRRSVLFRLLRLEFLDVLFRVLAELVAATAAADVVGLALVHDGEGADAAADDALGLAVAAGERDALLGGADLIFLAEQRLA